MNRLAWVLGFLVLGCGASGISDTSGTSDACLPGDTRPCDCDGGTPGTETCSETGWGACVCAPEKDAPTFEDDGGIVEDDGPAVCGDYRCDTKKGETCEDCPMDCGKCPECDLAPTCSGAFSAPPTFERLQEFDNNLQTSFSCGEDMGVPPEETTCSAPRLKMQIAQIRVHRNGLASTAGNELDLFCMIEATDGSGGELILTPKFSKVGDNEVINLSGESGVFWGQDVGKVKLSQFHITITYNCYRDNGKGVIEDVLDAVAGVGKDVASVPGNPYGWAFGLGSAAAAAASAAINNAGVKTILSVKQSIHQDALLLLASGKTWNIRDQGRLSEGWFSDEESDIELVVNAWGCSTPRPLPPQ